jgi:excisionase family DNA binding protein
VNPRTVIARMLDDPALVPAVTAVEAMAMVVQLAAVQTRLAAALAAGSPAQESAGPECYGMPDVAERLKMDVSHLYKLARRGELVTFRQGRSVRVLRDDLERFIAARRSGGTVLSSPPAASPVRRSRPAAGSPAP